MIIWIIQYIILSLVLIMLIHYLFTFFKTNLTSPKIKDLVNTPHQQYTDILNTINTPVETKELPTGVSNNGVSNNGVSNNGVSNNGVSNNGVSNSIKNESMKDELKKYLSKLNNNSIQSGIPSTTNNTTLTSSLY